MTRFALLGLLAVVGCKKDGTANKLTETGWFVDTGTAVDAGRCKARLGGVIPPDGTDDWYYRDSPSLWVEDADPESYTVTFTDSDGVPAPMEAVWVSDDTKLELRLAEPLRPSTDYEITVTDCAQITVSTFRTSAYGKPLTIDPSSLEGQTYLLDMLGADWIEPGGAESLIQLYFSQPALLGVRHADDFQIDMLGAPGIVDPFGGMFQSIGSTWDFPAADFRSSPYFESEADKVVFQFNGVEIPMHGARLAATFSADGTRIGGGELSGLGDTRELGEFLPSGSNDPAAICTLAESLGIECEPCPDGQPLCMYLEARGLKGSLVSGLTLTPRN